MLKELLKFVAPRPNWLLFSLLKEWKGVRAKYDFGDLFHFHKFWDMHFSAFFWKTYEQCDGVVINCSGQ